MDALAGERMITYDARGLVEVDDTVPRVSEIDGDRASGTVLCTARHLHKDPADRNVLVVIIRYVDRYTREADAWRIADREIRFLWSERQDMADADSMTAAAKG